MKVKTKLPVPSIAASGRWSKRADGEWGFDFDGDESSPSGGVVVGTASAGGSDSDSEDPKTLHPGADAGATVVSSSATNNSSSSNASSSNAASASTVTNANAPINLVLRMRDEKKELQDIKFEFLPNKDTVDEISHELVNAKLIDAIDMVAVSANLNKLLENHSLSPITFPLVCLIIYDRYYILV